MKFMTFSLIHSLLLLTNSALAQGDFWEPTGGPGRGEILALAIDSSGRIFVGSVAAGVFRSNDNGGHWEQINTGLTDSSVTALAIHAGYLFAGTWYGGGIFRSTVEGVSWSNVDLQPYVRSFAVSSDGTILAAIDGERSGPDGGVFLSTNDGESWSYSGLSRVSALHVDSKGTLFASGMDSLDYSHGSYGIFRSSDAGAHWKGLYPLQGMASPSAFASTSLGHVFWSGTEGVLRSTDSGDSWHLLPGSPHGLSSLVITPSGHIFCATFYNGGVFRSTDNGETWTEVTTGLTNTVVQSLAINRAGIIFAGTSSGTVFRSILPTTSVKEAAGEGPYAISLSQNYPNPFNPSTTITYTLPNSSVVRLSFYDMLGREVSVLVNERRDAGVHQVKFDASNLATGVYAYRLRAGVFVQTRKLLVLK